MSGGTVKSLLPYVGVLVLFFGAASTSGVALWRIDAQAEEIEKIEEGMDEIEDEVENIDRLIIQRQGAVDLRTQRIELQQTQQGEKLDEIIRLLRQERGQ